MEAGTAKQSIDSSRKRLSTERYLLEENFTESFSRSIRSEVVVAIEMLAERFSFHHSMATQRPIPRFFIGEPRFFGSERSIGVVQRFDQRSERRVPNRPSD